MITRYSPVVDLPKNVPVFDFSTGQSVETVMAGRDYGIGRYNERRPGMYTGFQSQDNRDIHMGIDLFSPVGALVHAVGDGEIIMTANNAQQGDYGFTVLAEHEYRGKNIYALYGHLGRSAIDLNKAGQSVKAGDVIGEVGSFEENGNWPPHVHFQLAWAKPDVCDMPGVVNNEQHSAALKNHPDPRIILGEIY